MKKGVLKSFANFTGKNLRWSLFLIKWQAFWPTNLLKRDSNTVIFPVKNNAYFEVETLEKKIYSCFLMSEVIQRKYTE